MVGQTPVSIIVKPLSPAQTRVLVQQLEFADISGRVDPTAWGYADDLVQKAALIRRRVVLGPPGGPFRIDLDSPLIPLAFRGATGLLFETTRGWSPVIEFTPDHPVFFATVERSGERVAVSHDAVNSHKRWIKAR